MPTFAQLTDLIRESKFVDKSQAAITNESILNHLYWSSVELASAHSFPQATFNTILTLDENEVVIPMCNNIIHHTVSLGGLKLEPATRSLIEFYRGRPGIPSFYYYNAKEDRGRIFIAPSSTGGRFTVQYVQSLDPYLYQPHNIPWEGRFDTFHDMIASHAAEKAYKESQEFEIAQLFRGEHERRTFEFEAFLRNISPLELTMSMQEAQQS